MIPFLDVRKENRLLRNSLLKAIQKVVDSGQYILGSHVKALEELVAERVGVREAVGLNSGTDALILALKGLGIGEGDEVVTTAYSFIATAEAIAAVGAKPVFVDIRERDATIDPHLTVKALTRRTKALLPVHLYGFVCDLSSLLAICRKKNLYLIEDCAQSAGAYFKNRKVGSFGKAGCYSFYPTKNLSALGDGGMVVTSDRRLALRIRQLRTHGSLDKVHYPRLGINSRLDEIQAALLLVKITHLNEWNQRRLFLARRYDEALGGLRRIKIFNPSQETTPVYHLYSVRVPQRDRVRKELLRRGIQTFTHYTKPIPHQAAFRKYGFKRGDFPVSERIAREVLNVPLYPQMRLRDQDKVIHALETLLA